MFTTKPKTPSANLSLDYLERIKGEPWVPKRHHKKGVAFLIPNATAGLFLDPGLGKTSITLKAFSILKKAGQVRRMVVIAPKRPCYLVWPKELRKWTDFHGLRMQILHGKTRHDDFIDNKNVDIYVINPDGLPWLMEKGRLARLQCDVLTIDESSKFKHTRTRRFKLLKPYLRTFKRRWILTGSPNPNGYLDLFGQIYILDLGKALGPFITAYRQKYFFQTGYLGYEWKLQPGAEKLIQKRIKPLILRLDADDYLQMPRQIDDIIRVELPDEARRVYGELESELFTQLDSGRIVTAASKGSVYIKCAQVANGGLYHNPEDYLDRRTHESIHNAKTEALADLADELQGNPLLVAYEFEHDITRIREVLKKCPCIGEGNMNADMRLEDMWNRGELPYMMGHPASMGHGLNLQEGQAHHVCWYGLTWDYELYDQFNRRIRRSGNKHAEVFVHHLIARDTVDEAKLRAIRYKGKTQKSLLDALRAYRKSHKK